MLKTMSVRTAVAAILTGLAIATHAIADTPARPIDVPAGDLITALESLAKQSDVNLVYQAEQLKGLSTQGVSGTLSAQQAVKKLLQGTKLRLRTDEATGAMLITSAAAKEDPQPSANRSERSTRLHLSETDTRSAGEGASRDEIGQQDAVDTQAEGPARSPTIVELEEILVTGTHIRGVTETASPTVVITREESERAGQSTVQEILAALPQNFAEVTPAGSFARGASTLALQNAERATGANLRGLGTQSTLTLLNGQRRAGSSNGRIVDISVIPLSAIERVEVVTGGRSAVYGADAVAGVVNFVTRRGFDGVEANTYYGAPQRGGERFIADITGGFEAQRGGLVASYAYQHETPFDLVPNGLIDSPTVAGQVINVAQVQPRSTMHSVFTSGRLDLGDAIELYADGLYSTRQTQVFSSYRLAGAARDSTASSEVPNDQFSTSAGLRVRTGSWETKLSGAYSELQSNYRQDNFTDFGATASTSVSNVHTETDISSASIVADGPLFSIGPIAPRAAIGAETRHETLLSVYEPLGAPRVVQNDRDRDVHAIFAEFDVPLAEAHSGPGLHRLDVSLAGRYDDYSDFGDTFNPQFGLVWSPVEGVSLRGAYSRAYRAPALADFTTGTNIVVRNISDPTTGGRTPVAIIVGGNKDLGPEKAETTTFGIDIEPVAWEGARLSLTYFNVDYRDRIDVPAITTSDQQLVLMRQAIFRSLLTRSPTGAQVAALQALDSDGVITNLSGLPYNPATQTLLAAFPTLVLFDNRTNNIALESVRGLDAELGWRHDTAIGRVSLGLNASYTLDHDRGLTETAPALSAINEVGKPADWRLRANVGWDKRAFGAYLYANYVDGYVNTLITPSPPVSAWTTFDLALRYAFPENPNFSLLSGFEATLSATNLLDEDPPVIRGSIAGTRYDPTNANPLGRFISLRLKKRL